MLSIEPVAGGGDYHAYLTSEYYLDAAQAVRWEGRGAAKLGLAGDVSKEAFSRLFDGYGPDGSPLVQNAGRASRAKPAWDCTFSAPKDVSALWAVADPETRERVGRCHEAAVRQGLDYLDAVAGRSRRDVGAAGEKRIAEVDGSLVVAAFGHGASREQDPQLHTHCVVFNVAVREDGTTGALWTPQLYRHKMAAGALYQATLASELRRELGLALTEQRHGFGLAGVPAELSKEWSKRREQIEQALGGEPASAAASAVAAKATRKGKERGGPGRLFERWGVEAREHGFGPEAVRELLGREQAPGRDRRAHIERAVSTAAEQLLENESHIAGRQLVKAAADRLRDGTATGRDVAKAVADWLARPDVVAVGDRKGETRYTTEAIIERERQLLADVRELAKKTEHQVKERDVREATRKQYPERGVSADDAARNTSQRAAVEHLLRPDGVSVLSGMAGTGKSTVLRTAREVWERNGYAVTGMALAGIAAKNLREASGIESETLAMRLKQLGPPKTVAGEVWRHTKNLAKTVVNDLHRDINLPLDRRRGFGLDRKTVVVVDEAGMVGTNDMAKLVDHVRRSGAKLVLVGDSRQLQPIAAGAPFRRIEEDFGAAELSHITRQRRDEADKLPLWKRQAVTLFSAGQAKEAFELFRERGLVGIDMNRPKARERLVAEWVKHGGLAAPRDHLILASTNVDVDRLNALCQRERLAAEPPAVRMKAAEHNGQRFHQGDRILFTKKDRDLGIENGETGTVAGVGGLGKRKTLTVNVDDGRIVAVPLDRYGDVRLGYAMTTHKAQGTTVENAYLLVGGPMQDRHLSYVQASRARGTTRFYVDRLEAGPELEELTRRMSQDRPKEMAHDVLDEDRERKKRVPEATPAR